MMVKDPSSPAKTTRPTLPEVVPRNRLFRLLDDIRQKPVIWVSAPAGSGKTTLASSYLQTSGTPSLWYQVDEGDSDIASFFYYMGLASWNAVPSQEKPLPLLTPEYALGIPTFTKRFFEDLFGRLPKPAALVLDNYQEVSTDSPLHQVVRDAMSVISRGINVFILSRNDPPKPFARLKANQSLVNVGWNQLRFNRQETHNLVKLLVREGLTEELIDLLHQRLDGWAAGLILMLSRPEIRDLQPESLGNYKPEEIFDYFAAELYESTDEKIRNFLIKTSIFPRMTATMAAELSGEDRAEAILTRLNREQFFTNKHAGSSPVYQYHSLFREFLLTKAHETLDSSTLAQMKQMSASLLEREGYAEEAVALYQESGNLTGMIELVLRLAPELMMQGRHKTLELWISCISDDILNEDPWLLYWQATASMSQNPRKSKDIYEKALYLFENRMNIGGTLVALSGILSSITYGFNSFGEFDQWIPRVEDFGRKHLEEVSYQNQAQLTLSMLYAYTLRRSSHPKYRIWENRALQLIQTDIDDQLKSQMLLPIAINSIFSGDLQGAESTIDIFRALIDRSPMVTPLIRLTLADSESFLYWLKADFKACQKSSVKALEMAENTGVRIMDFFLLGHAAAYSLSIGDIAQADILLQKMEPAYKLVGSWEKGFYHYLVNWNALIRNDLITAKSHAEVGLEISIAAGMPQTIAFMYLGLSIVLHKLGERVRADEMLDRGLSLCREVRAEQAEFAFLLAKTEFALDAEDATAAESALREAFALGKAKGYLNTYLWRSDTMVRLCAFALETGIEVEYTRELIFRRNLVPDISAHYSEQWPWKLRIYVLGEFKIQLDGQPLRFQRKAPNKILSMLKAVIALGGREVQKEKIIDALWPDAEGDIGNQSFATTLHRLRKLLGYSEAVELQEGKVSLHPGYCWIDAPAFELLLDEADKAWKNKSTNHKKMEAITLMNKALALYKGQFLVDESEEPWIISTRERLHSRFLRMTERLCKHLRDSGEPEAAIECYQRSLDVDDLAEELYAGLMSCYHQTGRVSEVLSVYDRCKAILSAKLGAKPSPKTEALRKAILRQQ